MAHWHRCQDPPPPRAPNALIPHQLLGPQSSGRPSCVKQSLTPGLLEWRPAPADAGASAPASRPSAGGAVVYSPPYRSVIDGVVIRDWIASIRTDIGFWNVVRQRYSATQ